MDPFLVLVASILAVLVLAGCYAIAVLLLTMLPRPRPLTAAEKDLVREKGYVHPALVLLLVAVLVAAIALPGCASLGGPRHVGTVGLVSAHSVLSAIDDTEMRLVCGRAGAPQAPLCVPESKHRLISSHLAAAYALEIRAGNIMRALPAGTPQPAEVVTLTFQIAALVQEILALMPEGRDKAALTQSIGGAK